MPDTILHISHTDISSDSRILKELNALASVNKYEISAIGYKIDENSVQTEKEQPFKLKTLKLRTRSITFLPRGIRYALNMLEMTLQLSFLGIRARPKIIHSHDTMVLLAAVLIKVFTGAKLVYDAHELESDKNGQTKLLSIFTIAIEKLCWSKVDLLISVSDSINRWYEDNIGYKSNIVVLNSPEIKGNEQLASQHNFKEDYFHKKFDIELGRKIFIYVGILSEGRGIQQCLQAFVDSQFDADLVFIGYGPLQEQINQYTKKFNNIHLHEPVAHEMVVPLIKNADMGLCLIENVSLSDYYCLPNKLFEYCFAGLPVLASDFPDIRHMVEKYKLGLCTEVSSIQINRAISQAMSNPCPIITTDLTDLSWETQAKKIINSYEQILGHRE